MSSNHEFCVTNLTNFVEFKNCQSKAVSTKNKMLQQDLSMYHFDIYLHKYLASRQS